MVKVSEKKSVYISCFPYCIFKFPLRFFSVDLEKDVNIFGRGTSNDVCFEPRAFKKNPQYQAISTRHFKLYRVCVTSANRFVFNFISEKPL